MTHTRTRRALALIAALLSLQALAGPALADTELGHTGPVGPHRLRMDTLADFQAGRGGATCYYYSTTDSEPPMSQLTVRFPRVLARNTTSGTDSRVVGWRPKLQRQQLDGTWALVLALPVQRKIATDASAAPFTALSFSASQIPDTGRLRVVVDMLWYKPGATVSAGGTIEGVARHRVDYYHWLYRYEEGTGIRGREGVRQGFCPGTYTDAGFPS